MARKSTNADSGSDNEPVSGPVDDIAGSGELENRTEIDGGTIDPGNLAGNDEYERDASGNLVYGASGKPRRKRGRKSGGSGGSGGASSGSAVKSNSRNNQALVAGIETLSNSLMFVHMGLAALTDFDKWKLEKKESDALANSIAHVMEQFDMTPDPRFAAVAGLITTAGMIYGPRVYLYREAKEIKRRQKAADKIGPSNQGQFNDMTGFNLGG